MTTAISNVLYSADFDADFVLISNPFLSLYNPNLTLTDMTDRMHFPAPPMLTRYFKRAAGIYTVLLL